MAGRLICRSFLCRTSWPWTGVVSQCLHGTEINCGAIVPYSPSLLYCATRRPASNSKEFTPSNEPSKCRALAEMPGPKPYPIIGTMHGAPRDHTKIIPTFRGRCEQYAPIYKEKLGGIDCVVLFDAEAIEKFFRHETKYPDRFQIPIWEHYREISGESDGVLTGKGEHWHRMRSVVDKPMLRVKDIASYADNINLVVTDMLDRLTKIRNTDHSVQDLETELFNWSLESIGLILYEKRFGGLSDHRDPELQEFIEAVGKMFLSSMELFIFPIWMSKIFKRKQYKEHIDSWNTLFKVAKQCVDERMKDTAEKVEKGEEVSGVLSYFLSQESLSPAEIYANVTELMAAAVDTTSNSVLWAMYEICQRPDVQDKLLEEVNRVVPNGSVPTYQCLQKMPFLKAVVKETLRLYPVAGSISRIVKEDIELCGYLVPKNSAVTVMLYVIGRLPQYYADPDEFKPERWMTDRKERNINPFVNIPFGIGTRMCIGRRVAELEMHLLLARLIQRFRLEPGFSEPLLISMQLVLKPDRPLKIKFIDRE